MLASISYSKVFMYPGNKPYFPRDALGLYTLTLLSVSFLLFLFIVLILSEVKGFLHWVPIISWDDSFGFLFSLRKQQKIET